MQVADAEGHSARVVTIAVHNPSRNIVEVRGALQRRATAVGKKPKKQDIRAALIESYWRALVPCCGSGLRPKSWGGRRGRIREAYGGHKRVFVILLASGQ